MFGWCCKAFLGDNNCTGVVFMRYSALRALCHISGEGLLHSNFCGGFDVRGSDFASCSSCSVRVRALFCWGLGGLQNVLICTELYVDVIS